MKKLHYQVENLFTYDNKILYIYYFKSRKQFVCTDILAFIFMKRLSMVPGRKYQTVMIIKYHEIDYTEL